MAQVDSVIHTLERVDVVATRHTDAVQASIPVQQIDRNDMVRMGIHSMTDALKHMAGISVRDYGGAGGMKTVSVRGIGARHTTVVYDGIALSDCQTGEIDLSRYSLDHIGSVSLVIGDGDNIFQPARNQTGAATLYMQTNSFPSAPSPLGEGRGEASLSLGSFGLVNPSFRFISPPYGGGSGRGFLFSAIGEFFHADNNYPFTLQNVTLTTRERRTNSRMNTWHGELNADWQIDARNELAGKVYYYGSNRRLPGIVHYYTNENHERLCDENAFGQLCFRSALAERWALQVNAKYNWSHTDYQNRTPGSGIGDAQYWQREAYGSASLLYAPTSWLSFDYALDVQENSLNSTLSLYDAHPHRTQLLQCLAAKGQWQRLTIVARALYHYSHDWSEASPSLRGRVGEGLPSISLSYRLLPHDQLYLRLMGKHIFRLPTFTELYFYHIGAAALQPERASQLNLGVTGRIENNESLIENCSFTADFYINKVTDKIVAVPFNMFVWRIMNLNRATIIGADVVSNVSFRVSRHHLLALNANYSWQRAMNSTERLSPYYHFQLPYIPQHTLTATLSWENPWADMAVTTSVQSCRWTTVEHAAGTRMPGFGVTDLSFWRTFTLRIGRTHSHHISLPTGEGRGGASLPTGKGRGGAPLTLRFTLQNLFDRQYALVAHYPMPGRSWRMQLEVPI